MLHYIKSLHLKSVVNSENTDV